MWNPDPESNGVGMAKDVDRCFNPSGNCSDDMACRSAGRCLAGKSTPKRQVAPAVVSCICGATPELATLRARVAELEARLELKMHDEKSARRYAEEMEQRAASLQAEVERLTSAWAVSREAAATHQAEARTLREALAESERKRETVWQALKALWTAVTRAGGPQFIPNGADHDVPDLVERALAK